MENEPSKILKLLTDTKTRSLKDDFFANEQKVPSRAEFITQADEWFMSTKINSLHGIEQFPNKDIIIGCTQFIENLFLKHKWNIQVLPEDYAYYTIMGKKPTQVGSLEPNIPLIVSVPNWKYGHRPHWGDILNECQNKNIDIHVDCAWLPVARNIELDFDHPNIKSVGMSISKIIGGWNRIGLRYSKQKTVDPITLYNQSGKYGDALITAGSFIMSNLERDYVWNTYEKQYEQVCKEHNLEETNFINVAKKDGVPVGIAHLLTKL